MERHYTGSKTEQGGAVLLLALMFLSLLGLLATGSFHRAVLQERMAAQWVDMQLAQSAAESALRGAEWQLWDAAAQHHSLLCGDKPGMPCYLHDAARPVAGVDEFRTAPAWVSGTARAAAHTYAGQQTPAGDGTEAAHGVAQLAYQPLYLIEDLGLEPLPGATTPADPCAALHLYRITARASGVTADNVCVLESTFAAPGADRFEPRHACQTHAVSLDYDHALWRRRSWRVLNEE